MCKRKNLGYTNPEESKLLSDAGLPKWTADMHYVASVDGGYTSICENGSPMHSKKKSMPCWSLYALQKNIPSKVKINDIEFYLTICYKDGFWSARYTSNDFKTMASWGGWDNILEMCVDIMDYCLEKDFVKKY